MAVSTLLLPVDCDLGRVDEMRDTAVVQGIIDTSEALTVLTVCTGQIGITFRQLDTP